VPAGAAYGKFLRLRGKGLKSLKRSGHGDLLVRVVIPTPGKISDRARKVLQEFDQLAEAKVPGPRRPSDDVAP
jgi:molecular chaperone DnaJ